MGRKTGRTKAGLYAVKVDALRAIADAGALEPGEVAVTIAHRGPSLVSTPLPDPSDLAWEVWRLRTRHGLSYGEIAQRLERYLAPRSKSANPHNVRVALAKKYVKQANAFLATSIGQARQRSRGWRSWRMYGTNLYVFKMSPWPGYDPQANIHTNIALYKHDKRAAKSSR